LITSFWPFPVTFGVEYLFEVTFLAKPDELLGHLAVFEQNHRGDSVDAIFDGDIAIGIGIHLSHLHLAA